MDDLNSTTLAYSSIHLERTFDVLITTCRPQCLPLAKRTLPANVLYLHARFAHYRCDETWLEEFIEGAVDRIEQGVYVSYCEGKPSRAKWLIIGKFGRPGISFILGVQHNCPLAFYPLRRSLEPSL